jgi:hypothetical protein
MQNTLSGSLRTTMHNASIWNLPFGQTAELELHADWGNLSLVPVEPGQTPRLELSHHSTERFDVYVDKEGETVRVSVEPRHGVNWFGDKECRATVYVPRDVRAQVSTNAGRVSVRDLDGCVLGVKANAGKIELFDVHGQLHLSADAGSVTGRGVGGAFDVETHAGSVRLEIADLQPGDHRIRATMGSVRLDLAHGLDVCIETHTSLGSVRNNFPSRPSAEARLILSTEMGSVRVDEGSFRVFRRPSSAEAPPPRPRPSAGPREDPELDRILKMVEAGELSAHDADELLRAMGRV